MNMTAMPAAAPWNANRVDTDYAHRLVLLRHAKSDWPDEMADVDRPLAKRGQRDAPVAGRWLARRAYIPDYVVCSAARRARETWELAGQALQAEVPGVPRPEVIFDDRVYEATVLSLLMLVREFPEAQRTILVVGHNPGLAELAVGLADPPPTPPAGLPTSSIAVLGLPGPWTDAAPVQGRLLDFAIPADMKSALRQAATAGGPASGGTSNGAADAVMMPRPHPATMTSWS
jgi:phosphohistidine phosphatase